MQEEITLASSKATEPKFSIAKAAEIIGVHPATVSRLMDSHKLGYYQVGTRRIVGKGASGRIPIACRAKGQR